MVLAAAGTLVLAAGTFNVAGPLRVHSGTTIVGSANFGSQVVFNLSGQNLYGFVIDGNASGVTITRLDIHSSNGIFKMMDGNLQWTEKRSG